MNKFLKGTLLSALVFVILWITVIPAAANADLNTEYRLVLSDSAATGQYLIDTLSEEVTEYDAAIVYDLARLDVDSTKVAERFAAAAGDALEEGSGLILSYGSPSFSYTALAALAMMETGIFPENVTDTEIADALKAMEVDFTAENPYSLIRVLELTEKYPAFFGDENDSIRESIKTALMGYYKTGEVNGFDYYGMSTDTNANMILGLLSFPDADEAVETAFEYLASQKTDTGYNYSAEYPGINANSTALAMAAYAKAGNLEEASEAFAMLRSFRSQIKEGAYIYGEEESFFSTTDAFRSLIVYKEALEAAGAEIPVQTPEDTSVPETPAPTNVPNPETGSGSRMVYTFSALGVMLMIAASAIYMRKDNEKQNESR